MDKDSVLNINLQPIADVTNNLIEKLASGIGWLATPRGKKAQQIEALNYLIEHIKSDESMPPLVKAASISNAKKLIKEYTNQNNIFNDAVRYLSTKAVPNKIYDVEDDWLEFFFDKAKNINKEDMQIIWSKLLAKEIEVPKSVSKHLLHILTVIDGKEACSFAKLANYCIKADGLEHVIIYYDEMRGSYYQASKLIEEELFRLEDIGLVQLSVGGYSYSRETDEKVTYFGKEIDIKDAKTIYIGNALLSRAGEELMSILTERNEIEGFRELLSKKMLAEVEYEKFEEKSSKTQV